LINIGILVSGRGTNMEEIIKGTIDGRINGKVVIVISDNKDAPAINKAKRYGIEAIFIDPMTDKKSLFGEGEENYIKTLKERNVDLVCLAGFMRILKKRFIEEFKGRIMNIHPSLLPAFPGLDAQRKALEYGVRFAGCSVHFVDESVDGGPIIQQAIVPVYQDDTPETLSERILKQEHRIYVEAINLFAEGRLKIEGRKVIIKEE
jgi:phosphoribosylglycinamide formyltransferase-1